MGFGAAQHGTPSTVVLWTVQAAPDSSFGMRPLGQHGGQPGAVASGVLIKMLMDLWLGNPAAISFPLALVLLHRCGPCEGQHLNLVVHVPSITHSGQDQGQGILIVDTGTRCFGRPAAHSFWTNMWLHTCIGAWHSHSW